MSATVDAAGSGQRFAVLRSEDAEHALCILSYSDTGEITIRWLRTEHRETIAEVLSAAVRGGPAASKESGPQRLEICRIALVGAGFAIKPVPASDMRMTVTVDESGRTVAVAASASQYVPRNADLEKAIFQRFKNVGQGRLSELKVKIEQHVSAGEHDAAARTFMQELASLAVLGVAGDAVPIAQVIDAARLAPEARRELVVARVQLAAASGYFGAQLEADVVALKQEFAGELPASTRATLLIVEGLIARKHGHVQAAYAMWKQAVNTQGISSNDRGWAYKNLSSVCKPSDAEAREFAQLATDAFLEAGNTSLAARCALRHANCLIHIDAKRALALIEDAGQLLPAGAPGQIETRAGLLHAKADALLRLKLPKQAFEAAAAAAELRAGLLGVEEARAASLHLAAHAARDSGEGDRAAQLAAEADAIIKTSGDPLALLEQRAAKLVLHFDADQVEVLLTEARALGSSRAEGLLLVTKGLHSGEAAASKLAMLEAARALLEKDPEDEAVALEAIARQLAGQGELARAIPLYAQVLSTDPLNSGVRTAYVNALWKMRRWKDAVAYLEKEVARTDGRLPGLRFALGRSLLEAGDAGMAAVHLAAARSSPRASELLRNDADKYLQQALVTGVRPVAPPTDDKAPLTREELDHALIEFARHISADKRMTFWRSQPNSKHKWIERPERHAQNTLHTFLKAKLGGRIEVFEELATGAGRIDLFLRGAGGLSVVVELKMLGAGYATEYAFSGTEQITHYMKNKESHLGYLVIFDARVNEHGSGLAETSRAGDAIVCARFVDVRPHVKEPKRRKRAKLRNKSKTRKRGKKPRPRKKRR